MCDIKETKKLRQRRRKLGEKKDTRERGRAIEGAIYLNLIKGATLKKKNIINEIGLVQKKNKQKKH